MFASYPCKLTYLCLCLTYMYTVCTVSSPMYVCALPTCTSCMHCKLTYACLFVCLQIQMLGYDISWAAFNIIEVMSSSKFTFKVC